MLVFHSIRLFLAMRIVFIHSLNCLFSILFVDETDEEKENIRMQVFERSIVLCTRQRGVIVNDGSNNIVDYYSFIVQALTRSD